MLSVPLLFNNCAAGHGSPSYLALEEKDQHAFTMVDGDMLVELDSLTDEQLQNLESEPTVEVSKAGRNLTEINAKYWKNGVLPLRFEVGFTKAQKDAIFEACRTWTTTAKVSCVAYNSSVHTGTNYINVTKTGEGCYATFGKPGSGAGYVNIAETMPVTASLPQGTCFQKGIIMHEFGHLLGMIHEHSRPDRNQYINILTANLKPDCTSVSYVYKSSSVNRMGSYDYKSIMHYAKFHCTANGKATITPKVNLGTYQLGDAVLKNYKLSAQDTAFAVEVYGVK